MKEYFAQPIKRIYSYLIYSGDNEDNFYQMKNFCGDYITISYEIAPGIGAFWDIRLSNSHESDIPVKVGDYIVKIGFEEFVVMDKNEFENYFVHDESECKND